jgi:hypothetical protein
LRPTNPITRGDFFHLLVGAAGWPTATVASPIYADVPATSEVYFEVATAHQHLGLLGYPCGSPTEPCDSQRRPYLRPDRYLRLDDFRRFLAASQSLTGP